MSKKTGIDTETHNTFTNFTSHRQKIKGISTQVHIGMYIYRDISNH